MSQAAQTRPIAAAGRPPLPLAGHIPYRHIHRHIHRHAGHLRGVAGEAWRADCGSRANLGVQGTADADRRRRFGGLATEGALWAPWHSFRTWTRSSAVSRRCSSSSSSSGSSLSAVSVPTPASSAVNVITVVTPTNQPTNLIPTPLGRYPRTAYSLHSQYSTYTLLLGWSYYSHYSYSCRSQRWGRGCTERAAAAVAAAAASAAAQQIHVSQARDGYPGLSVRTRHQIVLSGQLCSG